MEMLVAFIYLVVADFSMLGVFCDREGDSRGTVNNENVGNQSRTVFQLGRALFVTMPRTERSHLSDGLILL